MRPIDNLRITKVQHSAMRIVIEGSGITFQEKKRYVTLEWPAGAKQST